MTSFPELTLLAQNLTLKKLPMLSQRIILGFGLAVLLAISAASIGLDVKSRSDAAWVDHTLGVLKKMSDLELLVRRAESAARGYALTNDPGLVKEYGDARDSIAPAFAELIERTGDNPEQSQLLKANEALVTRRLGVSSEMVRLQAAGDSAGIAALLARAEGRAVMATLIANFRKLAAEEERLLADRTADSRRTGIILLAIDLSGGILILLLAALLIRGARRSNQKLQTSLRATEAANESLEAAVAERTAHLVAAHEELRQSASVLQSTFNSMAEAVLVIDAKGMVVLSNPAAQRVVRYEPGMTVEQLRARNTMYRADGSTLPLDEMPAVRVLRGEQFDRTEVLTRRPDRHDPEHFVISGRPLRDASGAISGAALVYHDITEARDTERQLQQAQKLDAIGKLTGGVAHDFNNMLTVITGTTETLVAGLAHQPDLQRVAALIDDAAERCTELIRHLLAFARKQPLQPRNVDINSAVTDIARLLRPTLGEQIEIQTVLEKEVATSHIDPSQLANSVLNMAINARDAMPSGGKLLLETRNMVLDEAYAEANAEVRPGPYVMLAVSDTGSGMTTTVRDKAFEPFFTTKEVGQGSGLGLSMVYGFVKQSGGHIKIYSEEGHGTTIRLYLPPAHGCVETAVSAPAPISGGTETILVVEDDALVRNFVVTQLHSLGYKTIAAADSRAALALVGGGQPFDLLFTDVMLPGGISGRQLANEVMKFRPGTKVLYTSGYTDNAIVHHGRLDEGVLLLSKPYRKPQLAQMVRRAISGAAALNA
jgi:PAS domain S-box-containing protein